MTLNRRAFVGGWAATLLGQDAPSVPHGEHPRLYFRAADLDVIRARMRHPMLTSSVSRLRAAASATVQGVTVARAAEIARSRALIAVLEDNEALGRSAVQLLLERVPGAMWDLAVQDISREIGLVMLSVGMVYDWCFRWLDGAGPTLIAESYRLARMLEVGYPPTGQGAVTGHAGEAMLFRDLLGTGLAIHDESPEMYTLTAGRILREFVPARDFFYPAAFHHQGSAYGPYRYRWEVAAAWIFERAGFPNPFSTEQSQVPYRWIYLERPDGRLLADGDMFAGAPATPAYLLAANLYRDGFLQDRFLAASNAGSQDPVEMVAFFDPDVVRTSVRSLPLARWFGTPFGGMVLRTGWNAPEDDPAIVELKIKEWHFNNHQHLDAGAFQIWYRGPLAMDSGLYRGYFTSHDGNYLKRTVAHNCLLLVDPAEGTVAGRWVPDGGQRWPNEAREARTLEVMKNSGYKVARTLSQEISFDDGRVGWAVLEGDLTEAYSPAKTALHRRSFVYIGEPRDGVTLALAVFDRVRAAKGGLSARWLLHTAGEPSLTESGSVSGNGRASLYHQALLPPAGSRTIESIGGPGAEFTVAGENYPPSVSPQPSDEAGSWRVEVRVPDGQRETLFLNLLQVTANGAATPAAATLLEAKTHTGLLVGNRAILFSLSDDLNVGPVEFELPTGGPYRCLVTGLKQGAWMVRNSGNQNGLNVSPDGHVASFDSAAGLVTLIPPA